MTLNESRNRSRLKENARNLNILSQRNVGFGFLLDNIKECIYAWILTAMEWMCSPQSSYFEIPTLCVMVLGGGSFWELPRASSHSPHNGISTITRRDTHQIFLSLLSAPSDHTGRLTPVNQEVGSHQTLYLPVPWPLTS